MRLFRDETVPPKELIVIDQEGQRLNGLIGPLDEHSDVQLHCQAEGGQPSPVVQWHVQPNPSHLSRHSQSTFGNHSLPEVTPQLQALQSLQRLPSGIVRNTLTLRALNRSSDLLHLQCMAQNTPFLAPLIAPITVELNRNAFLP
jgi:hypothetical protein